MEGLIPATRRGTITVFLTRAVAAMAATVMITAAGVATAQADGVVSPTAPAWSTITAGDGSVELSWSASSPGSAPVRDYIIQWRSVPDGSAPADWTDQQQTTVTGDPLPLATTVSSLTNGVAYEFRIRAKAYDAVYFDLYSDWTVSDGTVTPSTVPEPPVWGTLVPRDSAITVTWFPPENDGGSPITGYRIEISSDGGENWADVLSDDQLLSPDTRTYRVSGLVNGQPYLFRILAANGKGDSDWAVTETGVAPEPKALVVAVTAPTKVMLGKATSFSWAVVGGAKGARLARTITIRDSKGRVTFTDTAKAKARQGTVDFALRVPGDATITVKVVATAGDGSIQRASDTATVRGDAIYRTSVDRKLTASDVPYSYRAGCPVGPSSLARIDIPHWTFDGEVRMGQLVVAKVVVDDMIAVFERAFQKRFPIRSMIPIDAFYARGARTPEQADVASMTADNTSAFNCRPVVGSRGTRMSPHASGQAIDVNPFENPYVTAGGTYPVAAAKRFHRDRAANLDVPGVMTSSSSITKAFKAQGWVWGANWRYPDYQHWQSRYPMWS